MLKVRLSNNQICFTDFIVNASMDDSFNRDGLSFTDTKGIIHKIKPNELVSISVVRIQTRDELKELKDNI